MNYEIGKMQDMTVKREAPFGVYLEAGTGNTSDDILLPKGSMTEEVSLGQTIAVFIYRDSEDRIIATMKEPLVTVGQVRRLKVVAETHQGCFVDIGLERDVFVPKKETKYPLKVNESYLFKLYVDKTDRLCATTDVYGALELPEEGTFEKDEILKAFVLAKQPNDAWQLAIQDRFKGIIFPSENYGSFQAGDIIEARVLKFLDDGKPSLTMRKPLKQERLDTKDEILKALEANGGSIPYNDRSTPEEIRQRFNTSKNYFKMALGNLMKEGKIRQDEFGTHLTNTDSKPKSN